MKNEVIQFVFFPHWSRPRTSRAGRGFHYES
jgi:hypothetical protein